MISIKRIRNFIQRVSTTNTLVKELHRDTENYLTIQNNDLKNNKLLLAKLLTEMNRKKGVIQPFEEVEFQVFSQFGDDGIIQHIIQNVDFTSKTFIEFGVETYRESNTRFLLVNNNWSGMVIDGSKTNVDFIKNDPIYFFCEIYAKRAFITKENINELLSEFPYGPEIGILSVDIDGNDYYIWKEITVVNPILVIMEYNSVFGYDNPWTIPYDATYSRDLSTSSVLVYGTSLQSICDLAEEKGYYFIGCNSAGNNAYFLRKDKIGPFKPLSSKEGYVVSKFSEYFDPEKNDRVRGKSRLEAIKGKSVYNTRTQSIQTI